MFRACVAVVNRLKRGVFACGLLFEHTETRRFRPVFGLFSTCLEAFGVGIGAPQRGGNIKKPRVFEGYRPRFWVLLRPKRDDGGPCNC